MKSVSFSIQTRDKNMETQEIRFFFFLYFEEEKDYDSYKG